MLAANGCGSGGGDALRVVPEDARIVVVAPQIEELRRPLVAFLAGIQGASGALDLVAARWGVELSSEEALARSGIDPAGAGALFQVDSAVGVAVSVSDPEPFAALVAGRAELAGGSVDRSGEVWVARAAPDAERAVAGWALAFGTTPEGVGLLVATRPEGDAAERWRGFAAGEGGLASSARAADARGLDAAPPAAWASVRGGIPLPAAWGMAGGLLQPWASGLDEWSVHFQVADEHLGVRARAHWTGQGDLPSAWLEPSTGPAPFADTFPKTTTVFVRGRLDADRVRGLASFVRSSLIPERFPDLDGLPLPTPAELLELMTGDVAVALLGVDADVTVTDLTSPKNAGRLAAALQLFHTALALGVRDPAAAAAAIDAMGARTAALKGYAVAPLERGGFRGISILRGRNAYALLHKGAVVVFLTGAGEVERFLLVGEGAGSPLAAAATEPSARAALGIEPSALGCLCTLTRITRELAEKGVPPYFLKVLNDLRVLSAAVQVTPRELDLRLDVNL